MYWQGQNTQAYYDQYKENFFLTYTKLNETDVSEVDKNWMQAKDHAFDRKKWNLWEKHCGVGHHG